MDDQDSNEKPLWTIRPAVDSDKDFICYTYLASSKFGPTGLRMGAPRDPDAAKRFWLTGQRIIDRLIDKCDVTVAEAVVDGTHVICGYVIGESDVICHYVLTRRRFERTGVATDLLRPFLDAEGTVYYSHLPSVKGLKIPETWRYDPGTWLKWFE